MGKGTLLNHQAHWVTESRSTKSDLPKLNADEAALFDDLRNNRIGVALRMEQEYVAFDALILALELLKTQS